jgi:hypothetical protein
MKTLLLILFMLALGFGLACGSGSDDDDDDDSSGSCDKTSFVCEMENAGLQVTGLPFETGYCLVMYDCIKASGNTNCDDYLQAAEDCAKDACNEFFKGDDPNGYCDSMDGIRELMEGRIS